MSYLTVHAMEWDKPPVSPNPKYTELVKEVGEEKADALIESGLVDFEKTVNAFLLWLDKYDDAQYSLDTDGSSNNSARWRDYEQDCIDLSLTCPDVLFTLTGEGESPEDLWKHYFLNGESQLAEAIITYPECTLREAQP